MTEEADAKPALHERTAPHGGIHNADAEGAVSGCGASAAQIWSETEQTLVAMGFAAGDARKAVAQTGGDVHATLEALLSTSGPSTSVRDLSASDSVDPTAEAAGGRSVSLSTPTRPVVWTAGHSSLSDTAFVQQLLRHGISTLVDVCHREDAFE